jgi:hypothetical protein
MASPFEFAREWGGQLRPVEFPIPRPLLPSATGTFLHYAGVPKSFEVTTYQRIRFDFLTTAVNLASVWESAMRDYSFPVGWARLWRIGDITYTQAAAWLCIEELSGHIIAVDVDIDDPLYLVNSSVEGMMRCMRLLRDWARSTGGLLTHAASLQDAISRDPVLPAGEAKHYWLPLIAAAIDSGRDRVDVECE